MTFDEAMHAKCKRCGQEAQLHRLSPKGNFYCLVLNQFGINALNEDIRKYDYTPGIRDAMRLPARFLHPARFDKPGGAVIGTVIKDGLKNYVGQPGVA